MSGKPASTGYELVEPPRKEVLTGSFLVPAYREAAGMERLLMELDTLAQRKPSVQWEILVVDDGSDDGTADIASQVSQSLTTPVRVMKHRRNAGLGGALRTGLSSTTGDLVVTADADLSYGIDDLERLIDHWLMSRAHIVIASPYMSGGHTINVPSVLESRSRAANSFLSIMALENLKTLTGMVRAYDGPFIRSMPLKAVDADVMVEILYKAQLLRARIEEIPATLSWAGLESRASRSTLTSYRSRWVTYKQLVNGYLWRPFLFPLAPALVASVILVVVTLLGHFSWAALGVVCGVLAVQLSVASLMSLQAKRYFEELYNLGYGVRRVTPLEPPRVPSVIVSRTRDQS